MYDVITKQIFISQDVIFHEENFPFHTATPSDKLIEPFLDFVVPVSSLEPSPIFQFVVFTPSIDSNIPFLDSGGFSPTPDGASNNIAQELLWTRIFHLRPHSIGETRFLFVKN